MSTPTRTLSLVVAGLLATGCIGDMFDSDERASEHGDGELDSDDCKIEGSQIGVDGLEVPLGSVTVVFDSWFAKPGEPGEYMGFDLHTTGRDVGYVVKAGGESYHSTDASWTHPDGVEGDVSAISNVDFCEECDDPDGCDPGDPGEECNDPDGCDPGDPGDECNDPDGCELGDSGDPPECEVDEDCATGEFCEDGTCLPYIT